MLASVRNFKKKNILKIALYHCNLAEIANKPISTLISQMGTSAPPSRRAWRTLPTLGKPLFIAQDRYTN